MLLIKMLNIFRSQLIHVIVEYVEKWWADLIVVIICNGKYSIIVIIWCRIRHVVHEKPWYFQNPINICHCWIYVKRMSWFNSRHCFNVSKRVGKNMIECNNIYNNNVKIVLKLVNSIEIVLLRSSENNIFKIWW